MKVRSDFLKTAKVAPIESIVNHGKPVRKYCSARIGCDSRVRYRGLHIQGMRAHSRQRIPARGGPRKLHEGVYVEGEPLIPLPAEDGVYENSKPLQALQHRSGVPLCLWVIFLRL